jgi:DNA-binding Lrp family transcriptional regulator
MVLTNLPGVDATRLAGSYDIIAKINAESTESLKKIIVLETKKLKSSVKTDINCK